MIKPKECAGCPLAKTGAGFVCDKAAKTKPLFAVMFKHPGKMELVDNVPITGYNLRRFQEMLLKPLKIDIEDLLLCNTLRCYPSDGKYPIGKEKVQALKHCRRYDTELRKFKAETIGVTYSPFDLFKNPNIEKFLYSAFAIAKRQAQEGQRILILCGTEAKDLYFPNLHGGMKRWQRSFWKG